MKKYNAILLLLFLPILMACDDDDVEPAVNPVSDTEKPVISITSPTANATYSVIDRVELLAGITDNVRLFHIRVSVAGSSGTIDLMELDGTQFSNSSNVGFIINLPNSYFRLPDNAATATYTVIVEAVDSWANVAKNTVTFNVHAPDVNRAEFISAFQHVGLFEALDWWGGEVLNSTAVDETGLSTVLLIVVDADYDAGISEAEWGKFANDFNLEYDNTWSVWDVDGNGKLDSAEFNTVVSDFGFFIDWDADKNAMITEGEIANGIFSHWDSNQDNTLSRAEYLEKYFAYFID